MRATILVLSLLFASTSPAPAEQPAAASVPMLFRGATPAVEVRVNGQGPFLFAIDTGAQGLARVDSSLVERLKLETVDTVQGTDGSGRTPVAMPVVRLDSISLGGLEFKDVRAPSRNYNQSPNAPRIDGILGFNLFADYLLTLDFPARRVLVERGALAEPDGKQILGFELSRGIPIVELGVAGHTVRTHLDSGNQAGGFMLPTALVEKLTLAGPPQHSSTARSITGETEIKTAQVKGAIRLGRFEFADPTIHFPALSADANVGAAILQQFAITFDQKNNRLRLDRPAPAALGSSEYDGRFGERTISTRGGELFLQRTGGPAIKMVPTAKDEYTLEGIPQARLRFVRDAGGRVAGLELLNRDGVWEKLPRAQR